MMEGPKKPGEAAGQLMGAILAIIVRVTVNGLYIAALVKFAAWERTVSEDAARMNY